jgi:hypothetical protein
MMQVTLQDKVHRLEVEQMAMEQVEVPLINTFGGGIYARTILIRKGTSLTGEIHLTEHMNIVNGDIVVSTDEGMKRLIGYHVLVTKPGTKRVGYAMQDTTWTTLHNTEETDVEKIKAERIATSLSDPRLATIKETLWLG